MEGLSTRLIHHPYRAPDGFDAAPVAVHKASTVFFPDVAAMRTRRWQDKSGYTYGLHGTPTTFTLEERLATLEGARHCVLAPSGLAAIALVDQALLRSGDEVLIPDNAYGPNKALAEHELAAWGIAHRVYDPMNPADLAGAITPRTRLVWLEAAGSVTLEFPDVPALVDVVRRANVGRARPIVTALDDTWGAGVAYRPFELGADIAVQALTKYASGGADVLMGAVCTRDDALHHAVLMTHMRLGLGVGANDAELVLRGLPTLALRYHAQDRSARALAAWLAEQPGVAQVLHPALPGSPGHAHWQRDARAAAALLTVVFERAVAPPQVDAFCDALRLFRLGYSWAGPVSLCVPYDVPAIRARPWPHAPRVVRLAVGLEDVDDLRADLQQALRVLR
ncbi:cystathionine beta-lyase [Tepidimonas ignava]|jgi:cystathionine beta-lyase|uniref:Cystathionine beta-lyase n=1 Tax=Tepidimonas ignava TaxID=114249 RepID=A0A4R3LIF1_9BURK|nr:cystathionine beta-lyase [Tepidimonas ignava]TCS99979.1 cystathionine beta-lyase [Tepidimonas ignava]TSE19149.1 Cystathionine beta-lyase MetC [Tepidimonas ignava]